MSDNILTAARDYTAKGWVIHPLSKPADKGKSPGKKPLLDKWQDLKKTPKDIEDNIKKGCNIGLVCGKASGITIIDFDHELFISELFNGFDIYTLKSGRTKGRGHIYFKYNPNLPASKHHDLGIEVLNDGSNAVLPPSVHQSGDDYKWINPDAPIIPMPVELEKRLIKLFQIEAELKRIIAKCRHCFRDVIKRKPDMHGADGREYMIAVCADLKANGAAEEHASMFAKLVYQGEYDESRTLQEWQYINPSKTWQCETLKAKLPAHIDLAQCDKCNKRRRANTDASLKKASKSNNSDSQACALIKYAEFPDVELFHDETHNPYSRIKLDEKLIILSVKERGFKRWITQKHYVETGTAPGSEAISSALNVIEAKACFDGKKHTLHNRICWHDRAIWYDLGDWEAVKISSEGWEIVKNPPILFKRYKHQQNQDAITQKQYESAQNTAEDSIKKVLDFINIKDEKERLLFLVYLVSCFIPYFPHPISVLHGEKGAAKSTTFKIIKELVDPSTLKLATFPKDNTELVQMLAHHYFIGFDNVSSLSDWQSDALCRACTGEGFSKRELFTDDEDIIYSYQRCIGLNGINVVATKADLLDRSILLKLERIPKGQRRTEGQLWQTFKKAKGEVLRGIFTMLSKAISLQPSIQLEELPRMADFTLWGCAIAEALGYGQKAFLDAYYANIQAQNREAIEGSPVGELILKFMEDRQEWEGRPSGLLRELENLAELCRVNTKAKGFPKAANVVVRRLNELKSNLMDEGIAFETTHSTDRTIRIWKNIVRTVISSESKAEDHEENDDTEDDNKSGYRPKSSEEKKDDIRTIPKNEPSYISSKKNQEQAIELHGKDDKDGISRTYKGEPSTQDTCGICGNTLDGRDHHKVGMGLGEVHTECEKLPIRVKAIVDLTFVSANTFQPLSIKAGEIANIPCIQALGLITKKAAVRVEGIIT